MWRSPTFWRLFGALAFLLISSIGVLGTLIVNRVKDHTLAQIEDSLRTKAILVREVFRDRPEPESFQKRVDGLKDEIATRITLVAEDGRVLADSNEDRVKMENHGNRPEIRGAKDEPFGSATRYSSTVGQWMMYVAVRCPGDQPVGYVRVALPLDSVHDQLAWIRGVVWSVAAATAACAMVLAFWLARRITRPIQELTAAAEHLAARDYSQKVVAGSRDEIGQLARTFNDMRERLALQFAQLDEDRQQLRTILSGMVEGVIALDADEHILFANDRATQLLEITSKETAGRKLWELVRHRALQAIVRHALKGGSPCQEEITWDGTSRSLTVHAAPLPGMPPRGAVLVMHDTTELRRLERLRREFVANVSHELKTPLAVIKVCIETLVDGAVDDPKHRDQFLQQIADQAERLHVLILDLLSLARIEGGMEAFEFQAVQLDKVVAGCLEHHQAMAESKSQQLEAIAPPGGEGVAAWADEEAVSQILENLVDNALKYTPAGGRVQVRWWAEDNQVCVEVIDTGIGIREQDLARIFERFYRVDKARSRELGGTGLGLSIVKHLVQALNGKVSAQSRVGEGSTFTVWLPRAAEPPLARRASEEERKPLASASG